MPSFPLLRTGAITQYPSQKEVAFSTTITRFVDGTEQRFRAAKGPAPRWFVQLSQISEEEMIALEDFFDYAQGRFGSFSFVDPWDGAEYPDCSLEEDDFTATALSDLRWSTRLIIRSNKP